MQRVLLDAKQNQRRHEARHCIQSMRRHDTSKIGCVCVWLVASRLLCRLFRALLCLRRAWLLGSSCRSGERGQSAVVFKSTLRYFCCSLSLLCVLQQARQQVRSAMRQEHEDNHNHSHRESRSRGCVDKSVKQAQFQGADALRAITAIITA